MAIRELFHVMQVVDDFDAGAAFWEALCAPHVYMAKSWSDFDKRWALLGVVGDDFVIEVVEPSKIPGDAGFPLPKFQARFGEHLHSCAWYTDDLPALLENLKGRGVRVVEQGEGPATIFTHPKDTCGQVEFQDVRTASIMRDPRFAPGWSGAYWRDEHPLRISRLSHVTLSVHDRDHARAVYERGFGACTFHTTDDDEARRAYVLVGPTVVELAQPVASGTRLADDLARNGELLHALTFAVADLAAVERHLADIGVGVAERRDGTVVLAPQDCFGAVLAFTTASIPRDPRDL